MTASGDGLEAPESTLRFDPDGYTEVQLASGRSILVQDVEEVLLMRLEEFVATGNADVFQQCAWLVRASAVDRGRLRRRAEEEPLGAALDSLAAIAKEIDESVKQMEIWEITDLAKSLRLLPRDVRRNDPL